VISRQLHTHKNSWKNKTIPQRQRDLVDTELNKYKAGISNKNFDVFIDAISSTDIKGQFSLLEVGCSSGHYSEILSLNNISVEYSGCDYSNPFIEMANKLYPSLDFKVAEATNLPYKDNSFDTVVSGCCLLHISDYEQAISETSRVAKDYAIFHRTPILYKLDTKYYLKTAYGCETVEIHFNLGELVRLFSKYNLMIVDVHLISIATSFDDALSSATFVCKKIQ